MDSFHHAPLSSPERNGEDHERGVTERTPRASSILSDKSSDAVARQKAEEQFQFRADILRHVTDSVIVADLRGIIMYWNEGASAVFGYTAEEMMGRNTALLAPELDMAQHVEHYTSILAGNDFVGEWQGKRKDGSRVWVDAKTTVLRDTQGTVIGLIGIAKDITARKEAEERLRQSERRYREMAEEVVRANEQLEIVLRNVADGIMMVDSQDRLIYANDTIVRWNGYPSLTALLSAEQANRWHKHDNFTVWDEWGRPVPPDERPTTLALQGKPAHALLQYRVKGTGKVYWNLIRAQPVFDANGHVQFVIIVYTDLTEQKELEQRKDHFISMASHELKTPLTVLKVYTQLLLEGLRAEGRHDLVTHLSKMDDQISRLTKLVVDMLDISKMQAGQIEMAREAVDMEGLAREVVENLQPTTGHRLLMEGKAPETITGDRERLGQVLIILLTNAIKYSPRADTVVVRLGRTGETLTVAVQDFGIGIGPEHQRRIFERFYRVLSKQDKTFPGMGIGLYIAYEIIQRHGGKMWVESAEGCGSTFYFSLPV